MNLPLKHHREFAGGQIPAAGLASSLERRRLRFYIAQMIADAAAMNLAYLLADLLYLGPRYVVTHNYAEATLAGQLLLPIFFTIALQNGTYSLPSLKDWKAGASRTVAALTISAMLLLFVIFFVRLDTDFSHTTFVVAVIVCGFTMAGLRRLEMAVMLHRWGPNPQNVLIIDDGGPPIELNHTYRVNAADHGLRPSLDDPHAFDLLARYLRNMDQVIVSCPPERRMGWAMVLKGSGVQGEVLSEFMHEIGALGIVHRKEIGITTLLVSTGPLGLRARAMKRIVDVAASLLAIAALSPVLLATAAAIKLQDGGPVLFVQRRLGRGNSLFNIYKFRSMAVSKADPDANVLTKRNDDRVTPFGRFIRRTSIDELPQLFNVLKGDMSLVGPRPHAIGAQAGSKLYWEVDFTYWHRHALRPGLTGLAQVRGYRGSTDHERDLENRLGSDLEYLAGWSIWRDIRIVFATVGVLFHEQAF